MMAQDPTIPNPGQPRLYVLLSLSSRTLLLPQNDIRTLEAVLDVNTSEPPDRGVGWLRFEDTDWPVYSLDEALQPLSVMPPTQRICAMLNFDDGYFGLTCGNALTLQDSEIRSWPLPAPMRSPGSPLCGLALHGDQINVMSTTSALAGFLGLDHTVLPASE